MRRFTKKAAAIASASLLLVGVAGVAFAYWTQDGSGTGGATTDTTVAITINQTTPLTELIPGGTVNLAGTFDNPNAAAVKVGSVTASNLTIDATAVTAGCDVSYYSLGGTAAASGDIPSGNDQGTWSGLTVSMSNAAENQDDCKGTIISIDYDVAAAS